jgi:sugar O-acyltransferase (sialic acid O-acetyltransferase NeuD family)
MNPDKKKPIILLGGGSHAKVVMDTLHALGLSVGGYVDPQSSEWLKKANVSRITEEEFAALLPQHAQCAIGFLGLTCDALEKRYEKMLSYIEHGARFPTLVHPSAIVSPSAHLSLGVQVLPGAIINASAFIGEGTVINSGAVVEHDARIGAGVHISPGSVVLGGAKIEDFSYIGSGAVVIQNTTVSSRSFVKALRIHK